MNEQQKKHGVVCVHINTSKHYSTFDTVLRSLKIIVIFVLETRHCIKNNRNGLRVPDSYFFVRTKTTYTQTTRKVLFLFDTPYSRIDTPLELVVRS